MYEIFVRVIKNSTHQNFRKRHPPNQLISHGNQQNPNSRVLHFVREILKSHSTAIKDQDDLHMTNLCKSCKDAVLGHSGRDFTYDTSQEELFVHTGEHSSSLQEDMKFIVCE
ncbi:hypothetical protein J6590_055394 [Homalodisca vitripennis]|nr:hypothetical protein J6590_055394 [Homalodisca vitripennis]